MVPKYSTAADQVPYVQQAMASFSATVPEGPAESMYIALKRAIAAHSPSIMPPASKPLVLAGPFGAACRKEELLQWLLREHGDRVGLPELITTKARSNAAEADPRFKVTCLNAGNVQTYTGQTQAKQSIPRLSALHAICGNAQHHVARLEWCSYPAGLGMSVCTVC